MKYGTSLEHIPLFEYPDYFHLETSLIDGKEDTGYYARLNIWQPGPMEKGSLMIPDSSDEITWDIMSYKQKIEALLENQEHLVSVIEDLKRERSELKGRLKEYVDNVEPTQVELERRKRVADEWGSIE